MKNIFWCLSILLLTRAAGAGEIQLTEASQDSNGYFWVICDYHRGNEKEVVTTNDFIEGNLCANESTSNVLRISKLGRLEEQKGHYFTPRVPDRPRPRPRPNPSPNEPDPRPRPSSQYEVTCSNGSRQVISETDLASYNYCLNEVRSGKYISDQDARSQPILIKTFSQGGGSFDMIRISWTTNDTITGEDTLACLGFQCRGFGRGDGRSDIELHLRVIDENKIWLKAGFSPAKIYHLTRLKK